MSRKSDLKLAMNVYRKDIFSRDAVENALKAAHDLGRARGREDTYNGSVSSFDDFNAFTKRLRARVRRAAGDTR